MPPWPQLVPHACELVYTFGDVLGVTPGEEADLARQIGGLWTSFAADGTPAPASVWPPLTRKMRLAANDSVLLLDVASSGGVRVGPQPYESAQCNFWDGHRLSAPADSEHFDLAAAQPHSVAGGLDQGRAVELMYRIDSQYYTVQVPT